MEQVLCYWPDPSCPEAAAARRAMLPLKLRIRTADPTQTGQTVGHLIGRKEFPAQEAAGSTVTDPILILDGLSGTKINALLAALAKAKVPRAVFKAVVTQDNINWTLTQLWEELSREREAIEQGVLAEHTELERESGAHR